MKAATSSHGLKMIGFIAPSCYFYPKADVEDRKGLRIPTTSEFSFWSSKQAELKLVIQRRHCTVLLVIVTIRSNLIHDTVDGEYIQNRRICGL